MEIRRVHREDLPVVAKEFCQVFNSSPWNEKWTEDAVLLYQQDLLEMPHNRGWTAWKEEVFLGLLIGNVRHFSSSKTFFMDDFFTAAAARRQGVGKALFKTMRQEMQAEGCTVIFLTTLRDSEAFSFYLSQGLVDLKGSAVMVGKF